MKKVSTPSPSYRDEDNQDAISMHTTADDYEAGLPSYSDSEAAAASSYTQQSTRQDSAAPLLADPYPSVLGRSEGLQMSGNRVKNGNETSIRMEECLTDAIELENYIKDFVSVIPPNPLVRIVGTHQETRYNSTNKKREKQRVTDFDIAFSLQQYLTRGKGMWQTFTAENSEKTHRGSWRKSRAQGYSQDIEVGEGPEPSLTDVCRDYQNSKAMLKIFRIKRTLVDLDTTYLHKSIERAVRSTHYHGHLDISFPLEDKNVDIYSPHWINRARISWVRYLFYFTFLWIITWPILIFMTKWWSVYTVRWSWMRCETNEEEQRAYPVYASIAVQDWMQERSNLIKSLVLEQYQGDATAFAPNVPDERVQQHMRGSFQSTGNANVDSAVNFVQGGVGLWNAVQGRGGGDRRN